MSNAVRCAQQFSRLLLDWWQDLNACGVTGSHGESRSRPGAWSAALIPFSDWPGCARRR